VYRVRDREPDIGPDIGLLGSRGEPTDAVRVRWRSAQDGCGVGA